MEKLTREEFDEFYEDYMNHYRQLLANRIICPDIGNYYIELCVNPRGHFLVTKDEEQFYLGTSQEAAISAYNKALEEVDNVE